RAPVRRRIIHDDDLRPEGGSARGRPQGGEARAEQLAGVPVDDDYGEIHARSSGRERTTASGAASRKKSEGRSGVRTPTVRVPAALPPRTSITWSPTITARSGVTCSRSSARWRWMGSGF